MKTQNHFVEKKGCTPLLAKNMFSCSANTSGEEVMQKLAPKWLCTKQLN